MVPLSRNKRPQYELKRPGTCRDCGINASIWRVWKVADVRRLGFEPFTGEHKIYLTRTEVLTFSRPADSEGGLSYSGSRTEIYKYDKSGDYYLAGGSFSLSWSLNDSSGGFNGVYDAEEEAIIVTPYGDTLGVVLPSPIQGPLIDITHPSPTQEVRNYQHGTIVITLTDEFTEEMLRERVSELLSAIDLSDYAPRLEGEYIEAYFDGNPHQDPDGSWKAAEDARELEKEQALEALELRQQEEADAEAALGAAIQALEDAREAEQDAWEEFMSKRDAYEQVLVRIETWERRGNEEEKASAEGDIPDIEAEMLEAWGLWITANGDVLDALIQRGLARMSLGNARQQVADAEARVTNATKLHEEAVENRAKCQTRDSIMIRPGGGSLSGMFDNGAGAIDYYDLDHPGFVDRVRSAGFRWSVSFVPPARWSLNPPKAVCEHRIATVEISYDTPPGGGDPTYMAGSVSFEDGLDEVEFGDDDVVFVLVGDREIPAPTSMQAIFIAGLPSSGSAMALPAAIAGGAASKIGFPAYVQESEVPKFYLRETASGGFAGCPAKELPPKNYSGMQEFSPPPNVIESWHGAGPPSLQVSFSEDVPLDRRSLLPSNAPYLGGGGIPFHRQFADPGTILSATSRRWESEVQCGANRVVDQMTLTLSNEFTTEQLKALVDPSYEAGFDPDPEVDVRTPETLGWDLAINWLTPDERHYFRQKVLVLINFARPLRFSQLWWHVTEFTITWRRVEIDLETGEQSLEEEPALVDLAGEQTTIEVDPAHGFAVLILRDAVGPEDSRMWHEPIWLARAS